MGGAKSNKGFPVTPLGRGKRGRHEGDPDG